MTAIGITGHRLLPEQARICAMQEIRALLACQPKPVIGLSSLAEGSDRLFVEILLQAGGTLHAVLPFRGYENTFEGAAREAFDRLLADAQTVTTLDFAEPDDAAYDAAGRFVVDNCNLLVAVWDGKPARGLGGTADAVAYAYKRSKEIVVIWPEGVERP
ncbi:hypothetical protein Pth03_16540 [Planotetraspora thailandica]|uniref:DUF1273 domain-containing protein n=1 Tax=Planotetraspora thailandica TaxID=487172 RepID=A0A8J3VAN0_9ACTN|nr:hypothetical protein [Planotetraspora thailandica]GII53265.1 hypothetical protein Pth03_16540 [Planotetraspora thailandica]